ncbi:hypothetical protein B0J17DRAFT_659986 [Rhizoctonia solani]|nr:hypothetical protein B0J17DRAFT_659986 [Rhizoctonia solani]
MLGTPTQSHHSWLRQWEAAGANLAVSLATYLDSCLSLDTGKLDTALDSRLLVSKIDHTLESLHVELEQRIAQSRWTLARLRNKLAGTFYSIPQEILAEIFTLVVYDRSGCEIRFMEDDSALCTVWRKVGMSHGALWALIPMISRKSGWVTQLAAERSYEMAGGRELHLGASIEKEVNLAFIENIGRNFHRFRSANIVFENKILLSKAIRPLFKRQPASIPLTELSLYHILEPSEEFGLDIPEEHGFLTSLRPYVPFSSSIDQTVQSLRVLRLKNIYIHWQLMTFPKLVELRVESVMIGTKANFNQLLLALQTAPHLQKLGLISLNTEPDPDDAPASSSISVSLPNLQRLYLGDLYSDDAEMILRSITAGPYYISLFLTIKMASVVNADGTVRVGLNGLMPLLQGMRVDTLLLQGDEVWENWVELEDFRRLLVNMPSVTTLKLDFWEFGQSEWEALTRPDNGSTFAELHSISLSNIHLDSRREATTRSLERFLSSHRIQTLFFGGIMTVLNSSDRPEWISIKESDQMTHLLRSSVPEIQLHPTRIPNASLGIVVNIRRP